MRNFKNIRIILIAVLTFVISFSLFAEESSKTRIAKIIVPRAVVYADEYLNTPLGYIANGKYIHVGNPRKVNQEIVPLIVSGRIAYIELRDIDYQDDEVIESNQKNGIVREHNVDIILKKPEEKLNENNSIYFQLGRFDGGSELKQAVYNLESLEGSWLTSFGTFFLHRNPLSKIFWGAGFEYSYLKADQMRFDVFMFSPTFGYTFIRNFVFSVEAFANLDLATSTSFKIDNNYTEDPKGFMWGPQIGIRVIATPNTKYKIFGSLSYRKYSALDLSPLKRTDPDDISSEITYDGVSKVGGLSLNFGIGFDL